MKINMAEKTIRKAPNCIGVKPIKPFFMSMNELPQISESTIKINHFLFLKCMLSFISCKNGDFIRIILFIPLYGFH